MASKTIDEKATSGEKIHGVSEDLTVVAVLKHAYIAISESGERVTIWSHETHRNGFGLLCTDNY